MKSSEIDQKSFRASPAFGNESWGGCGDPSDSPRRCSCSSPRFRRSRNKVFSDPDLLQIILLYHLRSGMWTFHQCWALSPLSHRIFFAWISDASIPSNSSMSPTKVSRFQISPREQGVAEEYSRENFLTKLVESWLVFRGNRVLFNHRTKWNLWSFKRFSKSPVSPVRQEILNVSSNIPWNPAHHFSSRPHCNNTAEVPSSILRTALSAIPCVSERWRVDVQWFHDKVFTSFAKLRGSVKNLCKLLSVSWEVFVLHGYDWTHWDARCCCTTTAYRWLFRDSQPSLRTLWSAIVKSPKFSAWSTASPVRLLQGALVILILWQTSQFRPQTLSSTTFLVNFGNQFGKSWSNGSSRTRSLSLFFMGFWHFGLVQATGFPVLAHFHSHFVLMLDAV